MGSDKTVLVIGSGGREHALLTAMEHTHAGASPLQLHVAPGNAGMEAGATRHDVAVEDPAAVVALAKEIGADLVVIGPEQPLVAGVTDALREAGFAVFGPSQEAAKLEGSKTFAKEIMALAGVRTARAKRVTDADQVKVELKNFGPHFVVKDDGLAGGKGVVVTDDVREAVHHAKSVIEAGNPVLLETFLDGPEVSLFCLVDGETVVPLLPAQDHKRAYDNDEGPNTGGMGAYTPLPWLAQEATQQIIDEVVAPVAKQMVKRGTPYSGLLYAGLAWGKQGPAVVEFNARFGDPETQAVLALLESPLAEVLEATARGELANYMESNGPLAWKDGYAVTVVLAVEGYPASPRSGDAITGENLSDPQKVLHAGTALQDSELVSAGGRVLSVVGTGETLDAAARNAYGEIEKISLEGSFYRRDIARPAIDGKIQI